MHVEGLLAEVAAAASQVADGGIGGEVPKLAAVAGEAARDLEQAVPVVGDGCARRLAGRNSERPAERRSKSSTVRRSVQATGRLRTRSSSTMQRTRATLPVVTLRCTGNARPDQGWNGWVTSTTAGGCRDSSPEFAFDDR